jgi:hypothetical protein
MFRCLSFAILPSHLLNFFLTMSLLCPKFGDRLFLYPFHHYSIHFKGLTRLCYSLWSIVRHLQYKAGWPSNAPSSLCSVCPEHVNHLVSDNMREGTAVFSMLNSSIPAQIQLPCNLSTVLPCHKNKSITQ